MTDLQEALSKGISTPYADAAFIPHSVAADGSITLDTAAAAAQLTMDAATNANAGLPSALYTYINPRIITVLYGVAAADRIFQPAKVGSWTDESAVFKVEDYSGRVEPYADNSNNAQTDVNFNFPTRQQYRYQTTLKYGELETAKSAQAQVDLVARKQLAAAQIIARAENTFQLYGIAGLMSYGLLNDPNIAGTISPLSVNDASTWADKLAADTSGFANVAYADIAAVIAELTAANGGHVQVNDRLILAISNKMVSYLHIPNSYGKTCWTMLRENYPNIELVQVPEFSTDSGELLYVVVPELYGEPTGIGAYSERFHLSRVVQDTTSARQKASAGTYGAVIQRPSLIKGMLGI